MIFQAIEFAARAHSRQYRKGTAIPYIIHPLNVAATLINLACAEPIIIAGILHDTLEDTRITHLDLSTNFGKEIADLVAAVSEPNKSDWTWENRKAHTLKLLRSAPMDLLIISLADKLDNIKSIRKDQEQSGDGVWKRFNRPKEKQQWYYANLEGIFADRLTGERFLPWVESFRRETARVFGIP